MASALGAFVGKDLFGDKFGSMLGGVLGGILDSKLFGGGSDILDLERQKLMGDTVAGRQLKQSATGEGSSLSLVMGRARVPVRTFAAQSGWRMRPEVDGIPEGHLINFAADVCQGPISSTVARNNEGEYSSPGFIDQLYADGQPVYVRSGELSYTGKNLYFLSMPYREEVGDTGDMRVPPFAVSTNYDKYGKFSGENYPIDEIRGYMARTVAIVSPPWGPALRDLTPELEEVVFSGVATATYNDGTDEITFDPNVDGAFFGRRTDQNVPSQDNDSYVERNLDTQGHDTSAPGYDYTFRVETVANVTDFSKVGKAAFHAFKFAGRMDGWEVAILRLHLHRNKTAVWNADTTSWKTNWSNYGGLVCPTLPGSLTGSNGVISRDGSTADDALRFIEHDAVKLYPGFGRDVLLASGTDPAVDPHTSYEAQGNINYVVYGQEFSFQACRRLAVLDRSPIPKSARYTVSQEVLDPDGNTKYLGKFHYGLYENNIDDGFSSVIVSQRDLDDAGGPWIAPPLSGAYLDDVIETVELWSQTQFNSSAAYLDSSVADGVHTNNHSTFTGYFPDEAVPSTYTTHAPVVFGVGLRTKTSGGDEGFGGTLSRVFSASSNTNFEAMYEIDGTDLSPSSEVRDSSTPVGAVMASLYSQPSSANSSDPTVNSWVPNRPGRAWLVFNDFDLVDFGDKIPNLEAVVVERDTLTLADAIKELCLRSGMEEWEIDVSGVTGEIEGLTVQEPNTFQETLQLLLVIYRIDARDLNGKLTFTMREDTPTYTIDYGELNAAEGQIEQDAIVASRDSAFRAPISAQVRYPEDGNGLLINAVVDNLDGASNQEDRTQQLQLQLPFTMDKRRARLAARQYLTDAELALTTYEYRIPPSRLDVMAGDAVLSVVEAGGQEHPVLSRVNSISRGANFESQVSATRDSAMLRSLPLDAIPEESATGSGTAGGNAGGDGGGDPTDPTVATPYFSGNMYLRPGFGSTDDTATNTGGATETTPQMTVHAINPSNEQLGIQTLETNTSEAIGILGSDPATTSVAYVVSSHDLAGDIEEDGTIANLARLDAAAGHRYITVNTEYFDRTSSITLDVQPGTFNPPNASVTDGNLAVAEKNVFNQAILIGSEIIGFATYTFNQAGNQVTLTNLKRGMYNTDSPQTVCCSEGATLRNAFGSVANGDQLLAFPLRVNKRLTYSAAGRGAEETLNFDSGANNEGPAVTVTNFISLNTGSTGTFKYYTDNSYTKRRITKFRPTEVRERGGTYSIVMYLAHSLNVDPSNSPNEIHSGAWTLGEESMQSLWTGADIELRNTSSNAALGRYNVSTDLQGGEYTTTILSPPGGVSIAAYPIQYSSGPADNPNLIQLPGAKVVITGLSSEPYAFVRQSAPENATYTAIL